MNAAGTAPIERLLSRIPSARPCSRGWTAPCPAHRDRNPSLSITVGRDGAVLLKCFAGCEASAIVAALNLTLRDLFAHTPGGRACAAPYRPPTAAAIRAALVAEEPRCREELKISDGERLVAADINRIRHTVAVRLGVSLPPVERNAADSATGGHERDPLWPLLLDRAWREAWIRYDGREPCCDVDDFASHGAAGFDLLQAAEWAAAREIRAIVKRAAARAGKAA